MEYVIVIIIIIIIANLYCTYYKQEHEYGTTVNKLEGQKLNDIIG